MRVRSCPTVYEINTAVWLEHLGRDQGRPLELGEVPKSEWDGLAGLPLDAVWLMGVWQRSPAGREVALTHPGLEEGFRLALADLRPEDVIGSPYCVRDYVVDERFGGPVALQAAREQLAQRGIALILDYVPNHVALDHPWVTERPECFLAGSEGDLAAHPEVFTRTPAGIFAKGRDPYFEPWQDVLQLNAYSPELRDGAADTLIAIGDQCDGLRCDMAMLMTNEVFARTWGERGGPTPVADYWPTVIGRAKQAHPDLLFMAEVYWDMEWTLQRHGFDLCYDKRLYDRLVSDDATSIRGHLQADAEYQERLIRFIENHDEPRAAATFAPAQARAAAVVMSTLQGARLYHDGQLKGQRIRIPVQLGRGPDEPSDEDLGAFYERLLGVLAGAGHERVDWRLCDCRGWPDNDSYRRLAAWCWSTLSRRTLVVVNLSDLPAQARVHLPWADLPGRSWMLSDGLSGQRFERGGDELAGDGLYVGLEPWGSHLFAFTAELIPT